MMAPSLTFLKPSIVLTVGDDGIIAVPFGLKDSTPFFAATSDPYAEKELLAFVARHPHATVTLLADHLSQDYRSDELPPLNFFDRRKLVERRLKQSYPTARLTAVLRYKSDPRRVTMIGLQKESPLFNWADRLNDRRPSLRLLPVEGSVLASRLMNEEASNGWVMTLSRHKSGGLRQIVTFKNDLVFTRLTASPSDDALTEFLIRDVNATLDYLFRLGLREPKELSVLLLMSEETFYLEKIRTLSLKSIRSLSPHEAGKLLNLPLIPEQNDQNADILFSALTASNRWPRLSLRLPQSRKASIPSDLTLWGTRVACLCLIMALGATVWNGSHLAFLFYQIHKESSLLSGSNRALEQASTGARPIIGPFELKKKALERHNIFEGFKKMPWRPLNQLSLRFDPTASVIALDWNTEDVPEKLEVTLRLNAATATSDKAQAVESFQSAVKALAEVMKDYTLVSIDPPYHANPNDMIASSQTEPEDAVGRVTFERRNP